jgi:hypothetical protein
MNSFRSRVRTPVRRHGAESYLLITLLSFAASVVLTRLFLELTGYPQLGTGGLHIAHVLWGGLLLFLAALLPLLLANRWIYLIGAFLAGVGVGLFIDEVGKFITQSNDYFYPPAAPIIYTLFLLMALLYLQVRKPARKDTRAELYSTLDALEEILDHDLDSGERKMIADRLRTITSMVDHSNLSNLAIHLLDFIEQENLSLVPENPNTWQRIQIKLEKFRDQTIKPHRLRAVLTGGLLGLSIVSFYRIILLLAWMSQLRQGEITAATLATALPPSTPFWFSARLILEGAIAILYMISVILLVSRKISQALTLSYYSLLISLVSINLLIFYFDQFSTILPATIQFGLLVGTIFYRKNFT